jgi:phosphoribosylanthranilate isomerase
MTVVKFCGMTRTEDLALACELGVAAVGFVLWPRSPRHVQTSTMSALIRTLPREVVPVAVFVDPTAEDIDRAVDAGARIVQIHGRAPAFARSAEHWRAVSLDDDLAALPPSATLLLDAHDPDRRGGTGRTIDWERAVPIAAARRVMLAGGLTPANVAAAIRQVRPYGVDVASGIEERPGIKSAAAMRAFRDAAREANR